MAQLIQMRQRIKAIQTIKKITHAMRLISMSTHSRLRTKAPQIEQYQQEVATMFKKVQYAAPEWKNEFIHPETKNRPLIILAGSQKGLCGNFNGFAGDDSWGLLSQRADPRIARSRSLF